MSYVKRVIASAMPVAAGLLTAAATLGVVLYISGDASYQSRSVAGQSVMKTLGLRIGNLYETGYASNTAALSLMVLFSLIMILMIEVDRTRWLASTAAFIAVSLLPLLSLPYIFNIIHSVDVERVTYPLGFGFMLLSVVLVKFSSTRSENDRYYFVLIVSALTYGVGSAYVDYLPYKQQRQVIEQIQKSIQHGAEGPVLLRDWTGVLGDKYSFMFSETLRSALFVLGTPEDISICTPDKVEANHPELFKAGWLSFIPRCTTPTEARALIDLRRSDDGRLTTSTPGVERAFDGVSVVLQTGSVAPDESGLTWINEPRSVVYLHNETGLDKMFIWSAVLTSPPCPSIKPDITATIDNKKTSNLSNLPVRLSVQLLPHQTKFITLDDSGPVCRLEKGDDRNFYFGISEMKLVRVED